MQPRQRFTALLLTTLMAFTAAPSGTADSLLCPFPSDPDEAIERVELLVEDVDQAVTDLGEMELQNSWCDTPDDVLDLVLDETTVATGMPVRDCGYLDVAEAVVPDVPIVVRLQNSLPPPAGGKLYEERDEGTAIVTYDPKTDMITYSIRGEKWGLEAIMPRDLGVPVGGTQAEATIYLYDTPVAIATYPLGTASATAHCDNETREICQGQGKAQLSHGVIQGWVESMFNGCNDSTLPRPPIHGD